MRPLDRLALASAGLAGAAIWALQQPLDQRVVGAGYDDVDLLGRAVRPDGSGARAAGWAMHLANGAAFGLAYSEVLRRTPGTPARKSAQLMAQAENFGLYPLAALLDRVHPARGEVAPSFGPRQLVQATWRHALLGIVLGEVGERVQRRRLSA
jgi:hypothetical protein